MFQFSIKGSKLAAVVLAAGLGWTSQSVSAALVVDFDVDTNGTGSLAARTIGPAVDLDGDTVADDRVTFRNFTNPGETPWSAGVGYTGPALYGGMIAQALNSTGGTDDYSLFNIRVQDNGTDQQNRVHMALVFDDNAAGPLRFDTGLAGTSFMTVSGNGATGINRFESLGAVRWLVRNGTDYYISNTLITNDANGRILTAAELDVELWSLYDPSAAFAFGLVTNFNTPTSALTNLNAFGLITNRATFAPSRSWLQFSEFKVDAIDSVQVGDNNAVPEPATATLFAGLAALGLVRRRRQA